MAAAAVAVKRAGCVLRPLPCSAAGASQERPRGCCLTRSAPSLADPPAIARAGLIPGFLSALFDVVVFFLSGLSAVRHCCPPRTPESQVETNGQVVPGPEYESPNLNGSIGTSSPQEHLTGKELLDSSAKNQSKEKKKTAILLYLKDLMVSCPSCAYNTRPVPGGLQF
ncbi:uncharacterized protein LOC120666448 [Panicum virgatum]|uniref:uncharacterized protein LOC120666448 n=1 Tax=Panicum virgatum TaxID=38727 RepID=UPI0019D6A321|nr:uncharacterized protein LOC120666448 [Panicum virgatum]